MADGVTGNEQLQANVKLLLEALEVKVTRDAVHAAADVIRDEMVLQAPLLDEKTAHSTSLEPGAVKRDIRTRMHAVDKDGVVTAVVGPDYTSYVCQWLEFGHRLVKGGSSRIGPTGRLRGAGHEIGEVKPHPFIRRSYENSIRPAMAKFTEIFKAETSEALK